MRTETKKAKHAEYMREYNRKNKDKLNARRREKRLELIASGVDVNKENNRRNRKYYDKHKERLTAEGKAKNWNYKPEIAKAKREKYHEAHPGRNTLRSRKAKALKMGLVFELTENWYITEWEKGCKVTHISFDNSGSDSPWVAHIDRVIPENGYTEENCRLVCGCFNLAKKHWTDEDVLRMAKALIKNL
jgi:hypothetical protein